MNCQCVEVLVASMPDLPSRISAGEMGGSLRLIRILQMGLDVRVLSVSRLSACVGHLAAAKSVRSFRSIEQRTPFLKYYREWPCSASDARCQIPTAFAYTSSDDGDQGSSLRGEVAMKIEVDERQAGFRILRLAAHARI